MAMQTANFHLFGMAEGANLDVFPHRNFVHAILISHSGIQGRRHMIVMFQCIHSDLQG
jgi:hypothetical protein